MPQVPRYDGPAVPRTSAPRPLYPTSLPPGAAGVLGDTTGAGLLGAAQTGVNRIGAVLDKEFAREVDRSNQMAVTSAQAKLAELETRILHDPEKGVLNIHGKDALGGRQIVDEEWTKGLSEIEKGLTNDEQRHAFRMAAVNRVTDIHSTVTQHASRELENYDAQESQAFVDNERDAAISAAAVKGVGFIQVADRASMAIGRQRAAIADFAKRRNLAPEKKDQMMAQATSQTHAAIIEQLAANNDDITARSYFEEFKDQLKGKDSIDMAKLIQDGSLRGESQRSSDSILDKYKDDREGAIAEARKIKTPELRDMVEQRLHAEFNRIDGVERDNSEKRYLAATNTIEPYVKSGKPFLASEIVPTNVWSKLTLEQRNALGRRAGDRENDAKTWHGFLELTPKALGDLNQDEFETKYWSKFDNVTRTRAEAMWQQARDAKRTGKLDPKMSADITFKDQVNETLMKLQMVPRSKTGTGTGKMTDSQFQFWADFTLEATKEKEQLETEKGKPLTSTEIQKVIDGIAMKRVFVEDVGGWGIRRNNPQRLPGTILQDERKRAYVPWDDIPETERKAIQSDLEAARKTVTRFKVERLWAATKLNDGKLRAEIFKEP